VYSSDNTHHHILDASEAQGTISLQEVQSGTNEVILLVDVEEQRSHYYVQYNKPRSRARTSDDGNVPESTEPKRICAEPDLTSMGSQNDVLCAWLLLSDAAAGRALDQMALRCTWQDTARREDLFPRYWPYCISTLVPEKAGP
jgi:hypothetical protein